MSKEKKFVQKKQLKFIKINNTKNVLQKYKKLYTAEVVNIFDTNIALANN